MLDKTISLLKRVNENLDTFLSNSFSSYLPSDNIPFFTSYVLLLMKVAIIGAVILIPLALLKLWKDESSFLTILILTIIFVIALAIFGVFIGFFQILYS